jgi:hypothetical protein
MTNDREQKLGHGQYFIHCQKESGDTLKQEI